MKAQSIERTHAQVKQGPRSRWSRHILFSGMLLLCCLLILSACSKTKVAGGNGGPVDDNNGTPLPTVAPTKAVTPTPAYVPPVIKLSVVNCPALNVNWDAVAGTKANVNKVETVTCGNFLSVGYGALVSVRYYSPDAKLDVYVFSNIYGVPNKLPVAAGLLNGDALISVLGTVATAESGINNQPPGPRDVFKEYQWTGAGFSQVGFRGMYPDASMYQAMQGQAMVNSDLATGAKGNLWRVHFKDVSEALALKLFHWPSTQIHWIQIHYSTTGISSSQVQNLGPGGGGFTVEMYRVFGGASVAGYEVMEIMQVTSFDGTVVLNSPAAAQQVASPISVAVTCPGVNGKIGRIVVYDQNYVIIGDSGDINSPAASGAISLTKGVNFKINTKSGFQEGFVVFYWTTQNNTAIFNQAVMAKVVLT